MTEVKYYREYNVMRNSLLDMLDRFNELMRLVLQGEPDLDLQVAFMEKITESRSVIMGSSANILKGIILYNKGHTEIDVEKILNKYAEGVKMTRKELANFEAEFKKIDSHK